jgi:hypothetical protein
VQWRPIRLGNGILVFAVEKVPSGRAHEFWSCSVHSSWRQLSTSRVKVWLGKRLRFVIDELAYPKHLGLEPG